MKDEKTFYAVWKEAHSKPIYEDELIYHIGTEDSGQNPICGIHKRFPGNYNSGEKLNLTQIATQKVHFCKLCLQSINHYYYGKSEKH